MAGPGTVSDFKLYDQQVIGSFIETSMQESALFNAASGGTMVQRTLTHRGDFKEENFYTHQPDRVTARDNTSTSAATDGTKLVQGEIRGAKLDKKILDDQTEDAFYKQNRTPAELGRYTGVQNAKDIQVNRVNLAISSLVGSIGAGDAGAFTTIVDVSGVTPTAPPISHSLLNDLFRLWGDQSSMLTTLIMHSTIWHDLVGAAIDTPAYETQAFAIRTGTTATLGRNVLVTDSSALEVSAGVYRTIALAGGASITDQSEPMRAFTDRISGLDNIVVRSQFEWADTVSSKGYAFASNTTRPSHASNALMIADLEDPTKWAISATDVKSTAGAILITVAAP